MPKGEPTDVMALIQYMKQKDEEEAKRRAEELARQEAERKQEAKRRDEEREAEEARRASERAAEDERRNAQFQAMMDTFSRLAAGNRPPVAVDAAPASTEISPDSSVNERKAARLSINIPELKLKGEASYSKYKIWRQEWNDFANLAKLNSFSQSEQLSYLRQTLAEDMKDILRHSLNVPDDTEMPLSEILTKLDEYYKTKRGEALRRYEFNQCRQHQGESFDIFLVRLRKLADDADLCKQCIDKRIGDGIMWHNR